MANKITSFFKPIVQENEKINEENCSSVANSPLQKASGTKRKLEEDNDDNCDEVKREKIPMSPEQKARSESNKHNAQLLKMSRDLLIVSRDIGLSWFLALQDVFQSEWFRKLNDFVIKERKDHTIFPSPSEVWSWTTRVKISDIKVVILGQDPYHGPGQAHGLCFSVKPGVRPPPSLLNMFKELESDIQGFNRPDHGYLAGWADQGVLLLNACLTVRKAQANSHKDKGWEKVTDAVISWISKNLSGVVFLLWGASAQKKAAIVDKKRHHLLTSVHPSPLSAHRGFLGCKHFSKCNELLVSQDKTPIDWTNLPQEL